MTEGLSASQALDILQKSIRFKVSKRVQENHYEEKLNFLPNDFKKEVLRSNQLLKPKITELSVFEICKRLPKTRSIFENEKVSNYMT